MQDFNRFILEGSRRIKPHATGAVEKGGLPRTPRAVLFDVYGTLLVRVGDDHPRPRTRRKAVAGIIEAHRLGTLVEAIEADLRAGVAAEHARLRAGGVTHPEVRMEDIWQRLFPDRGPDELREAIIAYEMAVHPAWPMPGCRHLLAFLRKRGLVMGIVSNAQFYTPLFLQALLGAPLAALGFSASLCLYSCDFSTAKPGRFLFDTARGRLGAMDISARETLVIGNSLEDDVIPATRAGFMTVLAALDRRSYRGGVQEGDADAVIAGLPGAEMLFEKRRDGHGDRS